MLESNVTNDRLVWTLFLATLFHGTLIMGISFEAGEPAERTPSTSFDVVLIRQPLVEEPPDSASYLAAQNQRGSGNTSRRARPAGAIPGEAVAESIGRVDKQDFATTAPGKFSRELSMVVTRERSPRAVTSVPLLAAEPLELRMEARLSLRSQPSAIMDDADREALAHDRDPRDRFVSVNTREARFAAYLDQWRRHVEEVGNLNYPDEARRRGLQGNPVLEVAISADGSLHEIVVRESSNHKLLDQAALRILRLAAPFRPFPEEMRTDTEVLRFEYEWQFGTSDASGRVAIDL